MYIQLRFQYVYFVLKKTIKQNYQTLYSQLARNKFSFTLSKPSYIIILYFVFDNKYYNYNKTHVVIVSN